MPATEACGVHGSGRRGGVTREARAQARVSAQRRGLGGFPARLIGHVCVFDEDPDGADGQPVRFHEAERLLLSFRERIGAAQVASGYDSDKCRRGME